MENEVFSKNCLAMNEKVVYKKKTLSCINTAFIRDLGRCLGNMKDVKYGKRHVSLTSS
jgi:hypothetical protein